MGSCLPDSFREASPIQERSLYFVDGFGNVIDIVEYSDLPPWPDASFNGYYLKLVDPLSDNNIATNWIASTSDLVSSRGC